MFKRISIRKKLVLIALTFTVPTTVMLLFIIRGANKNIVFGELEAYGLEYQRPLEELLNNIQQHMQLSRRLVTKHLEVRPEIDALQAGVSRAFDALDAQDGAHGAVLQFTDEGLARRHEQELTAKALRAKWDELKSQLGSLRLDQSNEKHTKLLADIRAAIRHAGDTSNLILDSDLDSYYLIDVTLIKLPHAQERLAKAILYGEDVIRRNSFNTEETARLELFASQIQEEDIEAVSNSIQTSLTEDETRGKSESLQFNMPGATKRYAGAVREFVDVLRDIGKVDDKPVPLADFMAAGRNAREANFKFWQEAADELEILLQQRIKLIRDERSSSLIATALALLAASLLVLTIIRSITGPLSRIMESLNVSAAQVTSASGQLASSSQSLSSGASEQASSLEVTSQALKEMSATIVRTADNAARARTLSEQARRAAKVGDSVMREMKKAMSDIEQSSANSAGMIKIIDEIATQTNLLALNASVEAARAGGAGRGFAVVAEEVRKLAQRSADAARESATCIDAAATRSKLGVATSKKVAEALNEIGTSVEKTAELVGEIAIASKEQSQEIIKINTAVEQMDRVVQSNAANAEQTAASAEELEAQSRSVQETVKELSQHVGASAKGAAQETSEAAPDGTEPQPAIAPQG